mmetsp:Transcript_178418/g.566035  ORF Transcript_178418/g.566035 Transcript_178418/m.566035 type:complete len:215 (-) Transcript_178418:310-954(-)
MRRSRRVRQSSLAPTMHKKTRRQTGAGTPALQVRGILGPRAPEALLEPRVAETRNATYEANFRSEGSRRLRKCSAKASRSAAPTPPPPAPPPLALPPTSAETGTATANRPPATAPPTPLPPAVVNTAACLSPTAPRAGMAVLSLGQCKLQSATATEDCSCVADALSTRSGFDANNVAAKPRSNSDSQWSTTSSRDASAPATPWEEAGPALPLPR